MPPSELYLVGTVHNDLKGPRRLIHILEHLQPDVVSLESTEQDTLPAREMIDNIRDEVRDKGLAWILASIIFKDRMPLTVEEIIAFRFERECAYAWSVLNRKEYVTVEKPYAPDLRAAMVADVQRRATNLRKEYAGVIAPARDFQQSVDALYCRAVTHGLPVREVDKVVLADRDPAMAQRLYTLKGRVVHISGLMHIAGDYENLAHHCADFVPEDNLKRMTLYDAEIILDDKCRTVCEAIGLPLERLSAASPSR